MSRLLVICLAVASAIHAQSTSFPLETVAVEGTVTPKDVVLELTGLHVGKPIDQAGMEVAARKLSECGLFESVNYRYAPGPKRGYVLTLQLSDPKAVSRATIDMPGVNEDEVWQKVAARYPSLNHKVADNDAGQTFLSARIEENLREALEGHHITAKLETDLSGRRFVSF